MGQPSNLALTHQEEGKNHEEGQLPTPTRCVGHGAFCLLSPSPVHVAHQPHRLQMIFACLSNPYTMQLGTFVKPETVERASTRDFQNRDRLRLRRHNAVLKVLGLQRWRLRPWGPGFGEQTLQPYTSCPVRRMRSGWCSLQP